MTAEDHDIRRHGPTTENPRPGNDAFRKHLDTRTAALARQNPGALLDELSAVGFSWRDIANMLGVSIPALRRWRAGERLSGDNRRSVAQLVAFVEIIRDDCLVFDPASWMEVPVAAGSATTAITLYAAGRLDVVITLAVSDHTGEAVLTTLEPEWREDSRSGWEVAVAEDGEPYVRSKVVPVNIAGRDAGAVPCRP